MLDAKASGTSNFHWNLQIKSYSGGSFIYGSLHSNDAKIMHWIHFVFLFLERWKNLKLLTDIWGMAIVAAANETNASIKYFEWNFRHIWRIVNSWLLFVNLHNEFYSVIINSLFIWLSACFSCCCCVLAYQPIFELIQLIWQHFHSFLIIFAIFI